MPVGEILVGQGLPRMMLSVSFNFSFCTAYFRIILSFPPEAYRYLSVALNFKPYHDFGITTVWSTFFVSGLISCIDCVLCPLLVTAMYFLELDTAMFKGRSPSGRLVPTGVRLQPLGKWILEVSSGVWVWLWDWLCKDLHRIRMHKKEAEYFIR